MAGFSREVTLASGLLCSSSGSMQLLELHRKLLQRCDVTKEEFCFMVQKCPRFLLVPGERAGDCTVVAKTSLRLCSRYGREESGGCREEAQGCREEAQGCREEAQGRCPQLHICKFFIYGNCRFGKGRKSCKFSHDIRSAHNFEILRECTLHELNEDQLFLLLLQNDPALLPEVCLHYNKGSGLHGGCTFQENCTKVHLCQHFVQGDCMFGLGCKRQHAINQHGRRILEERGLSGAVIQELPFIYRNIHHLTAAATGDNNTPVHLTAAATEKLPDSFPKSVDQTDERQEICLHFTRNSCRFQNECRLIHFQLPYKWEVFDGVSWTDLQPMEDMERDFCDPSKSQSCANQPVNFLTMTQGRQPVRRLSTISSVTKPPHYILTTVWLWYYKGDQGNWMEYGQPDEKQRTTSVTSQTLEEAFLSGRTAEVKVVKGQRHYVISFQDMYQRNPKHKTKRRVCRRPRFFSVADVEKQKTHDLMRS
ncbi:protein mono-ADP-ribosyltransferase PARP12b isoform X2 [Cyclopterus lumpus]|uniref:protein mono-ADP-ribosyltransferase PARP12b isoform X2 n=1 Tax=Cyclopterus lumpus TaxID=8103 RepID=UPI00148749A3|nr:protein mono-ADP-ribosyltransferase PARP12b isoform X2 [Cyclopterus lumpus]